MLPLADVIVMMQMVVGSIVSSTIELLSDKLLMSIVSGKKCIYFGMKGICWKSHIE